MSINTGNKRSCRSHAHRRTGAAIRQDDHCRCIQDVTSSASNLCDSRETMALWTKTEHILTSSP
ncbi:MAG: hypothetical protein EVA78_02710 [Phycisphaeraceae bacterium]|nr:MAG: hypothetical protein EVA78_02710 [Phycisphaeraceae bacterium]